MKLRVAAVTFALAAGLMGAAIPAASAANPDPTGASARSADLPVPYTTAAVVPAVLKDPSAPPPGANDWGCRPSAAHPNPVVLVHGLGATMAQNWNTISPLLKNNGYCVFALTYGVDPRIPTSGGVRKMEDSSRELASFVDHVKAATGAVKVDLVGHSEGTAMPQYYLKRLGGAAHVARYVAITPLYQGTTLGGIDSLIAALKTYFPALGLPISSGVDSYCGSCQQFVKGSQFLTDLYSDGVYAVPGVQYTTIMTRYDEAVTPYTSGRLDAPNATNIVVQDQCPLDYSEHVTVAFDPIVGRDILNALDPAHPKPVPCTLVLPGIGAPQAGTFG